MSATPLAAMGEVVHWSSVFLLLLLCVRLRRSGINRYAMRTWIAAWAALLAATAASLVGSAADLLGGGMDAASAVGWLGLLAIPGTLVFAILAGCGALDAAGRRVPPSLLRIVLAVAVAVGAAVEAIDKPILTGSVLVAVTFGIFWCGAVVVARAERRDRPHRFPLLAAAMAFFGAVTLLYQVGEYFGQLIWPLDDFAALAGWSAGYAGALGAMVLAGALIVLLADDAHRGVVSAHQPVAAPEAPFVSAATRMAAVVEAEVVEIATVLEEATDTAPVPLVAAPPDDLPVPAARRTGLPLPRSRTVTLPRPPIRSDGLPAEVFLIDDEAAVRATLARVFQRGGWSVRDVSTGEEALAWLLDVPLEDAPAAILCDFKMPGMGGGELHAHLLRERPILLDRIVFMAGDASRESARAFVAATPCPLVAKPCSVSEIARAVEQVLAAA